MHATQKRTPASSVLELSLYSFIFPLQKEVLTMNLCCICVNHVNSVFCHKYSSSTSVQLRQKEQLERMSLANSMSSLQLIILFSLYAESQRPLWGKSLQYIYYYVVGSATIQETGV